jgi:uncharacterized membrane protein (UPF0127 family)
VRLAVSIVASVTMGFMSGCSRTPEEPTPVPNEIQSVGKTSQPPPMSPPPTTNKCPNDPAPQLNKTLYSHGHAAFVTPDGVRHEFDVEIAETDDAQERGLMYRTGLDEGAGMVFTFKIAHQAVFWMKNTCIPLDMVFVDESNRVIGVVTAPPLNEDPRQVPGFSKYVVELAAGVAQKTGISLGTTFVPPLKS